MPQVVMVKTSRTFPGRGVRGYRAVGIAGYRRRGVGQSSAPAPSATDYYLNAMYQDPLGAPLSALSDLWQNASTGTLSPNELAAIQASAAAQNKIAATSPVTGVVNTDLLNQANQELQAESAAAANVTNQSTGSTTADFWDDLMGTGPGFLNTLGLNPGGTINWAAVLEALLITGAVVAGGIFIINKL